MTEEDLDRASKPLRDVISPWTHEHGLGSSSGFDRARRLWIFNIYRAFIVEVDEDGGEARIVHAGEVLARAMTPTGLRRVMDRVFANTVGRGYFAT